MFHILVLSLLLAACNDTQTATTTDDDGETTTTEQKDENESPVENSKGTLYLQSYIVGGLQIGWLWLGDDGNFVKNPVRGADPLNIAAERELNTANTGTYTKNGDVIAVTYQDGKKEDWKMEYLDGRLNTIDGWFVQEQEGLPNNYKLNGSFTGNFKIGYVGKQQTYTFRDDGSFSLGSTATVNVDGAGGTATGEPESGTYAIKGNTLHLTMNNGDQSVALIGVIPGDKPSIIINYSMFTQ